MEKRAYWQYLKNSLELEDFILPTQTPVVGFFVSEAHLPEEEKALFEKMIAAMGLSPNRVDLFFAKAIDDSTLACKVRVDFNNDPLAPALGAWQDGKDFKSFTTHSLKNLLANPLLKKSAWEHLKTVRANLPTT